MHTYIHTYLQEEEEEPQEAAVDVSMEDAGEEGEVGAPNVGEKSVIHASYRDEREMARAGHRYLRTTLKKNAWVLQVMDVCVYMLYIYIYMYICIVWG